MARETGGARRDAGIDRSCLRWRCERFCGRSRGPTTAKAARRAPLASLQPANRTDLLPLGQALHLLPPSTPPGGDGGTRDQRLLTHLAIEDKVSASTQNQALSALLFLYRNVLAREIGDLGEVIRARKPKRLPVVMTREEAKAVLDHLRGDKWLMASLMYGSGMRLMECFACECRTSTSRAIKSWCATAKAHKIGEQCRQEAVAGASARCQGLPPRPGLGGRLGGGFSCCPPWTESTLTPPPTGGGNGSFRRRTGGRTREPARRAAIIPTKRSCNGPLRKLCARPDSSSTSAVIPAFFRHTSPRSRLRHPHDPGASWS